MVFRERIRVNAWNRTNGVLTILLFGMLALASCSSEDCPVCPKPPVEQPVVPYISYFDEASHDLICAKRIGDLWGITIVDHLGTVGYYSSLALDAQGNPHICYRDYNAQELKYAVKTQNGWAISIVDTDPNVGLRCALALDAQGNPHISHIDATSGRLRHAWKAGGIWLTETITVGEPPWIGLTPDQDWAQPTSIAVDAQGNPHMSYYTSSAHLGYLVKISNTWSFAIVDSDGNVGGGCTLKLDRQGNPRISYWEYSSHVRYARKDGGFWNVETIAEGIPTGAYGYVASLALDAAGNPHISYYTNESTLGYLVKTASGWGFEVADGSGNVGADCSLALDGQGNPHISYWDATNYDLKHAVRIDDYWVIDTVDPWGYRGKYTSIAIGSH